MGEITDDYSTENDKIEILSVLVVVIGVILVFAREIHSQGAKISDYQKRNDLNGISKDQDLFATDSFYQKHA